MTRVVVVVDDLVGLRRILSGKLRMSVCAVKTLLVPVDHGLPVVVNRVCQRSPDGELGEVDFGDQLSESREELVEADCLV